MNALGPLAWFDFLYWIPHNSQHARTTMQYTLPYLPSILRIDVFGWPLISDLGYSLP